MRPNPKNYLLLILVGAMLVSTKADAQKWVADTLYIQFGIDTVRHVPFSIQSLIDERKEKHVAVFEKKKALVFPVDQIVSLEQPFDTSFLNYFSSDSTVLDNFEVEVESFYISHIKQTSKRIYTLFSSIELSAIGIVDTSFLGTLYYEYPTIYTGQLPLKEGYEATIDAWAHQFITDVQAVNRELDLVLTDDYYHFRRGQYATAKNMYTGADFFFGLKHWGIDGQIWFAEPEGNRTFSRMATVLRYVNHPDFHALAIGRNIGLWNYRLTDNWLFTNKLVMLIGFNNWKNMQTVSHTLEEIPYFNVSITQSVAFNQLDKKGLVFGLGLMEDLHYVIYHPVQLKLALTLNCTLKF